MQLYLKQAISFTLLCFLVNRAESQSIDFAEKLYAVTNVTKAFTSCTVKLNLGDTLMTLQKRDVVELLKALHFERKKITNKNPDFIIAVKIDSILFNEPTFALRTSENRNGNNDKYNTKTDYYQVQMDYTAAIRLYFFKEENLFYTINLVPKKPLMVTYNTPPLAVYDYTGMDISTRNIHFKRLDIYENMQQFQKTFKRNIPLLLEGIQRAIEENIR